MAGAVVSAEDRAVAAGGTDARRRKFAAPGRNRMGPGFGMAAEDALGVASEIPLRMFRRLTAPPQHEQANLVFHSRKGFVEVSVALADVAGLKRSLPNVRERWR